MKSRIRSASFACIVIFSASTVASAQTTTTPSAHFGALLFPRDIPGYEFGIHLNRFTEYDKKTEVVDGIEQPIRFNGIDKTFGFNLAALSVTNRLGGSNRTLYRLTFQAGVTANEPTSFLQNRVVHDLRDIPHVPVGKTPTQFDAGVEADLARWFGDSVGNRAFAGAGAALGTINQDLYLQAGLRSVPLQLSGRPIVGIEAVLRAGHPMGGLAFEEEDLANGYVMAQGAATFHLGNSWTRGLLPLVQLGITYSTGFFAGETGDPIDERFWTIRIWWSERFVIETWNDSLNNTDRGPTFGGRITTALTSIPGLDRVFHMNGSG